MPIDLVSLHGGDIVRQTSASTRLNSPLSYVATIGTVSRERDMDENDNIFTAGHCIDNLRSAEDTDLIRSDMSFRLVPKSAILIDLERRNGPRA